MKRFFLIVFITVSLLHAKGLKVVFMGFFMDGAPSFVNEYERVTRDKLSVLDQVYLMDYVETARLKEKISFGFYNSVSRKLVESMIDIVGDSTLVVWGSINNYKIEPRRHMLIGARAAGNIELDIIIYSLSFKTYAYVGTVKAETMIKKPPVFFGQLDKSVNISAKDRVEIVNKLGKNVTGKTAALVSAVVRNQIFKTGDLEDLGVTKEQDNSIESLFEIPGLDESPESGEASTAPAVPAALPVEETRPRTPQPEPAAEGDETGNRAVPEESENNAGTEEQNLPAADEEAGEGPDAPVETEAAP